MVHLLPRRLLLLPVPLLGAGHPRGAGALALRGAGGPKAAATKHLAPGCARMRQVSEMTNQGFYHEKLRFTKKNGDFTTKNGSFTVKPMKNDGFTMKNRGLIMVLLGTGV